jgi:D-3-phosphoglycerate dehydrogenase
VLTERQERSVAGTVFSDGKPRIIQIKGINMEAELSSRMLYITNNDRPGFIGRLGTTLGDAGINIARMQFGRDHEGGNAIALVSVDQPIAADLLTAINRIEHVQQVKSLSF